MGKKKQALSSCLEPSGSVESELPEALDTKGKMRSRVGNLEKIKSIVYLVRVTFMTLTMVCDLYLSEQVHLHSYTIQGICLYLLD